VLPYPEQPHTGIGGYNLTSPLDQVLAFDYEGAGNLDDLVLFRAGSGTAWVLQNQHAIPPNPPNFSIAFQQDGNPPVEGGIGGFDLFATVDTAFAFDFAGTQCQNYLLFYRPGTGAVSILKNNKTTPGSFDPAPYQAGSSSPCRYSKI